MTSWSVMDFDKRKEAMAVCERMREHFSAWMGGSYIDQGYHECTAKSLLEYLGDGAWIS